MFKESSRFMASVRPFRIKFVNFPFIMKHIVHRQIFVSGFSIWFFPFTIIPLDYACTVSNNSEKINYIHDTFTTKCIYGIYRNAVHNPIDVSSA